MTKREEKEGKREGQREEEGREMLGKGEHERTVGLASRTSSKVANKAIVKTALKGWQSFRKAGENAASRESLWAGWGSSTLSSRQLLEGLAWLAVETLCEPVVVLRSLQRRRLLDERTVWSSQLCHLILRMEESLAGGRLQQAGIFRNWRLPFLERLHAMKGPRQPGQKVVLSGWSWGRLETTSSCVIKSGQAGPMRSKVWERIVGLVQRMWELVWIMTEPQWQGFCRSFGETSQWDLHRDSSEALEWCVGSDAPLSVADPTVLRLLGLRLQGDVTQTNENPFNFLPGVWMTGRWWSAWHGTAIDELMTNICL